MPLPFFLNVNMLRSYHLAKNCIIQLLVICQTASRKLYNTKSILESERHSAHLLISPKKLELFLSDIIHSGNAVRQMLAEIANPAQCPCLRYLKHKSSRKLIKSGRLNDSRCCGFLPKKVAYCRRRTILTCPLTRWFEKV